MVSSNIKPGAIVEAQWLLPEGGFKPHPALIISTRKITDEEEIFIAVMLAHLPSSSASTFSITADMVSKPSRKASVVYAKCHLVGSFDATAKYDFHGYMYQEPFQKLLMHFQKTVLGL